MPDIHRADSEDAKKRGMVNGMSHPITPDNHPHDRVPATHPKALLGALCVSAVLLAGCAAKPDIELRAMVDRGEYARAAARVSNDLATDRGDREYMLDRMRLGISLLADGRPAAAEPVMNRAFEILRTQGINDDKTAAAAVFGEGGVIFWKGEPFEQAMMFHYIAVQKALMGEWDNARAAAQSSLFLLRDFGENERGDRRSTEEIAEEAWRRADGPTGQSAYERHLDKGYTPAATNFALGHFMSGVANLALSRENGSQEREDEARDHFREAITLEPGLREVAQSLLDSRANTVFVVDYGPGPEKVRYGPDDSLARFVPRLPSDARPLSLSVRGSAESASGLACDLNEMARDHMWNNLEDLRAAKSSIGNAMIAAGAVTLGSSREKDETAQIVGWSLIGAGILSKLTAGADTRHCEVLPQRVYVAAAMVSESATTATISIAGGPRMTLPGLDPPPSLRGITLHYVRMPMNSSLNAWAGEGRVLYSNDSCACAVAGDELPYILGGRCVRKPSYETLRHYQAAGHLLDRSVEDLENLYRAEGIRTRLDPRDAVGARHILEGGDSLDAPVAGSSAFTRLFCQEHPAWQPRSKEVIEAAARERGNQ